MKKHKYNAKPVTIDGYRFASTGESRRYAELKLMERAKEISHLTLQPVFTIDINGCPICKVILDFSYLNKEGIRIYEDVKSGPTNTALSKIKRKMVCAAYNINVDLIP